MSETKEGNFLLKINKINGGSHAANNFLKPDDIIVALDNQVYTFGEKQLTSDLKELKKSNQKSMLTVLREDIFFNLLVENSLGCKFTTTTVDETNKIKSDYLSQEVNDLDELKEFIGMRDVYRFFISRHFSPILASLFAKMVAFVSIYSNYGSILIS